MAREGVDDAEPLGIQAGVLLANLGHWRWQFFEIVGRDAVDVPVSKK